MPMSNSFNTTKTKIGRAIRHYDPPHRPISLPIPRTQAEVPSIMPEGRVEDKPGVGSQPRMNLHVPIFWTYGPKSMTDRVDAEVVNGPDERHRAAPWRLCDPLYQTLP